MNHSQNKITLWMLAFCLMLTIGISPALAKAQASSNNTNSGAAKPAAPANPSATPAAPKTATKAAAGAPSSSEIAAAKASGKVWVNTESGVYHKSGRWYGKTKAGKFMTEAEAKTAGYKEAQKRIGRTICVFPGSLSRSGQEHIPSCSPLPWPRDVEDNHISRPCGLGSVIA